VTDWSLYAASFEPASSLAGYSVLDAVGVPLGSVSGWAYDGRGQVGALRVGVRSLLRGQRHYLVPLGYVTQVDPRHRFVHLREVTRRTIARHAALAGEELPLREELETLVREAPNPRPEICAILQDPHAGPVFLRPGRLTVEAEQGDGGAGPPPTPAHLPDWAPLAAHLSAPAHPPLRWVSLASVRPDEAEA
jgi:hypothetical protein